MDFWYPMGFRSRAPLMMGSALLYLLYYRWKHGSQVARHVWKVAGYPQGFWPHRALRPKVVGGCDPTLCVEADGELEPVDAADDHRGRNGGFGESA